MCFCAITRQLGLNSLKHKVRSYEICQSRMNIGKWLIVVTMPKPILRRWLSKDGQIKDRMLHADSYKNYPEAYFDTKEEAKVVAQKYLRV